jgi:hypothetical protein
MRSILILALSCLTAIPCELLVKARDATHADPAKDKMCWKQGQIVAVKPDGHIWGKEEGLPRFWIIKIPGMPVEKANQFTQRWAEGGTNYARTLWKFNRADFPLAIRNKLASEGAISIPGDATWSQLRNVLRNAKTAELAPANP